MSNKKFMLNVCNDIQMELVRRALSYLKNGMTLFEEMKKKPYLDIESLTQVSIGNLAVSIELMLKATIAKYSFAFLYKGLPDELAMMLTYHEDIEGQFRSYAIGLQTFEYKSIEFNEAVGRFYIIFPKQKQGFKPHLSFISSVRNNSLHSLLPKFQQYDLERVTYTALKLYAFLEETGLFGYYSFEFDEELLEQYEEDRIKRVEKAISDAKDKSKRIPHHGKKLRVEDWDHYIQSCPICSSDAILEGFSDVRRSKNGYSLYFYAHSFVCKECGLTLLDQKELERAGLRSTFERSDDPEKWLADSQRERL